MASLPHRLQRASVLISPIRLYYNHKLFRLPLFYQFAQFQSAVRRIISFVSSSTTSLPIVFGFL